MRLHQRLRRVLRQQPPVTHQPHGVSLRRLGENRSEVLALNEVLASRKDEATPPDLRRAG